MMLLTFSCRVYLLFVFWPKTKIYEENLNKKFFAFKRIYSNSLTWKYNKKIQLFSNYQQIQKKEQVPNKNLQMNRINRIDQQQQPPRDQQQAMRHILRQEQQLREIRRQQRFLLFFVVVALFLIWTSTKKNQVCIMLSC